MTPTPPSPDEPEVIKLRGPGDTIGSVPYLLGFHPTDSVVVIATDPVTRHMVAAARMDLPEPGYEDAVATRLAGALAGRSPLGLTLVIIAPAGALPDPASPTSRDSVDLPRQAFVDQIEAMFSALGCTVEQALWAAASTAGAAWRDYHDPRHAGAVPDLTISPVAAHSVLAGLVTYANREEMAALFAPDHDDVLARRAMLLAACKTGGTGHRADRYRGYHGVERAVREARQGRLPTRDEDIIRLAVALGDHWIRDACLRHTHSEFSVAAEQLWLHLVRAIPGPDRAEPAVLLAVTSYLRGDAVASGMALNCALTANPRHRLGMLMTDVVECGMPPARLRRAVGQMVVQALDQIMESSP
jgi:hypothetical protein